MSPALLVMLPRGDRLTCSHAWSATDLLALKRAVVFLQCGADVCTPSASGRIGPCLVVSGARSPVSRFCRSCFVVRNVCRVVHAMYVAPSFPQLTCTNRTSALNEHWLSPYATSLVVCASDQITCPLSFKILSVPLAALPLSSSLDACSDRQCSAVCGLPS